MAKQDSISADSSSIYTRAWPRLKQEKQLPRLFSIALSKSNIDLNYVLCQAAKKAKANEKQAKRETKTAKKTKGKEDPDDDLEAILEQVCSCVNRPN
jgi:hypothetical protein